MVSIARVRVVQQSSFGLPGQYGRRVTRVNRAYVPLKLIITYTRGHTTRERLPREVRTDTHLRSSNN